MPYKSVIRMEPDSDEFTEVAKGIVDSLRSDLHMMPVNCRVDLLLSEIDSLAPRAELDEYARNLNNYAVAKMIHAAAKNLMPLLGLRQTAIECLSLIEDVYKEIKSGGNNKES